MVFHAEENIIVHQLFKSKGRISHLRKVRNKKFPIIWTFPFVRNSCFCNNFFFSFIETYVSFNHFKDLLNIHYKMKYEAKLRKNFSLSFQWLQHDIRQLWWHQRSLKQNLVLQFSRNRNEDDSILTETHINLDQIHHIRNNWLGVIFFSPGVVTQWHLHLGLEGVTMVDTDPKRRFMFFKFTPLMTEFSVFILWTWHQEAVV